MRDKPFNVGDRVTRHRDVYDQHSPLLHGTIIQRYGKKWETIENTFDYDEDGNILSLDRVVIDSGLDPELYIVQWDNGAIGYGFLRHGLDKE